MENHSEISTYDALIEKISITQLVNYAVTYSIIYLTANVG